MDVVDETEALQRFFEGKKRISTYIIYVAYLEYILMNRKHYHSIGLTSPTGVLLRKCAC